MMVMVMVMMLQVSFTFPLLNHPLVAVELLRRTDPPPEAAVALPLNLMVVLRFRLSQVLRLAPPPPPPTVFVFLLNFRILSVRPQNAHACNKGLGLV
jgi:hypothetical protein